jgi:hypothetical protein
MTDDIRWSRWRVLRFELAPIRDGITLQFDRMRGYNPCGTARDGSRPLRGTVGYETNLLCDLPFAHYGDHKARAFLSPFHRYFRRRANRRRTA